MFVQSPRLYIRERDASQPGVGARGNKRRRARRSPRGLFLHPVCPDRASLTTLRAPNKVGPSHEPTLLRSFGREARYVEMENSQAKKAGKSD